jgi:hypothetical protein
MKKIDLGRNNILRLNYTVYPNKKRELTSIDLNGEKESCSSDGKAKHMLINKLDIALLEEKPLFAKLSIGDYKFKVDFAETIEPNFGGYYVCYEKIPKPGIAFF